MAKSKVTAETADVKIAEVGTVTISETETKQIGESGKTPEETARKAVSSLIVVLCDKAKAHNTRDEFKLLECIAQLTESLKQPYSPQG